MKKWKAMKYFLLLFLTVSVTACGFSPVYKADRGVVPGLASIEIAAIEDRLGQQMRGYLIDRMGVSGNNVYRLNVRLRKQHEGFGIRADAAATQEQVTLWADFDLVRLSDDKKILSDTLRARSSFDLVLSDFASLSQREDTERRLAFELADQLQAALSSWLYKQSDATEQP